MQIKRYIILTVILLPCLAAFSQTVTFQTEGLKTVATVLKLERLDTLLPGIHRLDVDGRSVIVRKNKDGVVEHIGVPVFNTAFRTAQNNALCDFMEEALLYKTNKITDNSLTFEDVKFLKGDWNALLHVTDDMALTINTVDDKAYQVIWKQGGKEIINVLVPINYELLSNTSRRELEHNFMRDLRKYRVSNSSGNVSVDAASLRMAKDGKDTLYVKYGKTYLQESVSDNTYYILQGDTAYVPILDKHFPVQSMANLAMLGTVGRHKATIQLTAICSDKNNEIAEVDMKTFQDFAASQGCTVYFGFESQEGNILKGALFLNNKELGYDHVFSLQCNVEDLGRGTIVIKSRGYLFTPTTNVKNLYNDMKK